jgi:hypothetical protein
MPTNFLTPRARSARTWLLPEVKIGTPYFFSQVAISSCSLR